MAVNLTGTPLPQEDEAQAAPTRLPSGHDRL